MQKNENRSGYKKTKAGWIPKEWPCFRLKKAVLEHNAGVYKKQDLYGSGHPIVGVADLYGIDKIDSQEFRRVPLTDNEVETYGLKEGDLLYGESSLVRSGIARTVYVTKAGAGTAFAWHTRRYKVNADLLNSVFLYYYLQAQPARKFLMSVSTQTALTGITTTDYFQCPVPRVPLPEQEAIAEALECWDKALRGYEKKIEKKRNIKKGLMQRLLSGEQRLPGFDGEWKEVRLGEIGCVVTGNTPPKKDPANYGNEYCWATAEDFINKYITDTNLKLSEQGKDQARMLPAGSVLVTCIASIGLNAIARVPMATNQQINALIVDTRNFSNEFVYYLISKNKQYLQRTAGSGAVPILSKGEFEKIKMFFPLLSEQTAIASVLAEADGEIDILERKLSVLRDQKRFLVNNMVTGTIRLPQFMSASNSTDTNGDSA